MSTQSDLLKEVLAFIRAEKMFETHFGIMAVRDGNFVNRLRAEKNMTFRTVARVRAYMLEAKRPRAGKKAAQ